MEKCISGCKTLERCTKKGKIAEDGGKTRMTNREYMIALLQDWEQEVE